MDRKSASSGTTLVLPSSHRQLRACLNCRLVKTAQQWKDNCENGCEFGTTSKFTGMVCYMNPRQSWVARWQKSDNMVRGMYALKVPGGNLDRAPEYVEEEEEKMDDMIDDEQIDEDYEEYQ
ncbi:hypothetical protein AAMO2058_000645200 [Amorphochlora amoebiformis]